MKTFKQFSEDCWTGYKAVGTKKKGVRTVPNCVPVSEDGMAVSGPANVQSSGAIAGTGGAGGEPGVNKKRNPTLMSIRRKTPQ